MGIGDKTMKELPMTIKYTITISGFSKVFKGTQSITWEWADYYEGDTFKKFKEELLIRLGETLYSSITRKENLDARKKIMKAKSVNEIGEFLNSSGWSFDYEQSLPAWY
ncbi:hypothetical protein DIEEDFHO_00016 [Enterococcus phage vB_OCPT_Bill]|uniref:Uncharacterized protein n=1 Tax=Enterococcus phage vB_OCPT_Bill TaxID=2922322 RepID=A0AAE9K7L7_9CAUD|nr:hypothetical protein DIEEDFHO_00016 [Enterococcus phage vB_OCPT_Bill]